MRSSALVTSTRFATGSSTAWFAASARTCSTSFRREPTPAFPIEMTEVQKAAHDDLNQPIAQLVQRSLKRPLTQAEFLKLMSLLSTQRIISNGMAQLQFEDLWPTIRNRRPDENTLRASPRPSCSSCASSSGSS